MTAAQEEEPNFLLGARWDITRDFDGRVRRCYVKGRPLLGPPESPTLTWWIRVDPPMPQVFCVDDDERPLACRDELILVPSSPEDDIGKLGLAGGEPTLRVLVYPIVSPEQIENGGNWTLLGMQTYGDIAVAEKLLPRA
jgi:hypothetical protein